MYEPLFRAEMRVSAGLEEGARGWTDAEAAAVARASSGNRTRGARCCRGPRSC